MGLALKLATGAGKTTVMAMLIAWQTIDAVRRPVFNVEYVDVLGIPFDFNAKVEGEFHRMLAQFVP